LGGSNIVDELGVLFVEHFHERSGFLEVDGAAKCRRMFKKLQFLYILLEKVEPSEGPYECSEKAYTFRPYRSSRTQSATRRRG
jgi:hypothetical protein